MCSECGNEYSIKEYEELQVENEKLKKEVADYHQLQWQHDALIDENEKLKGELEMERDDCSNAKKCEIEYHKAYDKELDENAKLRKEHADEELRKALHALWMARALRAKLLVQLDMEGHWDYIVSQEAQGKTPKAELDRWFSGWDYAERKCLQKAKEFE